MPTISVVHSTVAEVIAGVESEKSISPGTLKEALTSGNMYGMNFASVTGNSLFGDGSNLTGLIRGVSGNSFSVPYSDIVVSAEINTNTSVVSLCAKKVISPEWFLGATNRQLNVESSANRTSQAISNYSEYLDYIRNVTQMNPPMLGGTITTPSGSTGGRTFIGGSLMADGRIFMVPGDNGAASGLLNVTRTPLVYDPNTDSYTTPGGNWNTALAPGSYGQFNGAVLMANGKLFVVPRNNLCAIVYDPSTDTISTPIGGRINLGVGNYDFSGGCLMADGRVILSPYSRSVTIIYDPVTDTCTTPGGVFSPVGGHMRNPILLKSGKIFFQGGRNPVARVYDPVTDTISTPSSVQPSTQSYGTILMRDGRIFQVPSTRSVPNPSMIAYIYDPDTNQYTTPNGLLAFYTSGYAWKGGTLLQDGRVLCVPHQAVNVLLYNPYLDIFETPGGTFPTGGAKFDGAINMRDGRVLIMPYFNTTPIIFNPYITQPINNNVLTGPFVNR